jgi:uncharacterized membrane protein
VKLNINFRSKSLEEREAWLSGKFHKVERSDIILCAAIAFYGIFFSLLTILRYYSFMTRAWDFGIFTQSFWTTLYANRFLYNTCELFVNPSGSFFGVHFSPILFFILPFYRLVTAPETLLVIQSFILALAAVPIYKLAKEYAGGRIIGLLFAAVYLIYPSVHFVNWYDFHVQAFLPLFFGFTMYYITKENWPKYFLFLFLSLLVEEHAAWIVAFTGVYITWKHRRQILSSIRSNEPAGRKVLVISVATILIGGLWYWFTLWQRNTFFPTNPEAAGDFLGSTNFAILGATDPLQIPWLVITRPWNAIQALAFEGQYKLLYFALLFGPLAYFSFKAPSALIPTIPWFAFSFFSQSIVHHTLSNHYQAYLVAFIFAASVFGLRKNFLKTPSLRSIKGSIWKIVAFSLVFFFITSPLCPVINLAFPDYTHIGIGPHELQLNEVVSMIPANASILTQNNIFPQVSQRVDAYVVPDPYITAGSDSKILALRFVNETIEHVDYILLDNKTDPVATSLVVSLLESKPQFTFVLIATRDNDTIRLYWNRNLQEP